MQCWNKVEWQQKKNYFIILKRQHACIWTPRIDKVVEVAFEIKKKKEKSNSLTICCIVNENFIFLKNAKESFFCHSKEKKEKSVKEKKKNFILHAIKSRFSLIKFLIDSIKRVLNLRILQAKMNRAWKKKS